MCRVADVVITLTNGQVIESGDVHARGGPESPLTREQVIQKFMEFASPSLGEARTSEIRDAVLGFTSEGSKFSDLGRLIYDAPAN